MCFSFDDNKSFSIVILRDVLVWSLHVPVPLSRNIL